MFEPGSTDGMVWGGVAVVLVCSLLILLLHPGPDESAWRRLAVLTDNRLRSRQVLFSITEDTVSDLLVLGPAQGVVAGVTTLLEPGIWMVGLLLSGNTGLV